MKKLLLSIFAILISSSLVFGYTPTPSDLSLIQKLESTINLIEDNKQEELYNKIVSLPILSGRGGYLIQQIKEILSNNINKPNYVNVYAVCEMNDGFYERALEIEGGCTSCKSKIGYYKASVYIKGQVIYFLLNKEDFDDYDSIGVTYHLTSYDCGKKSTTILQNYSGNYEFNGDLNYLGNNVINIFIYGAYMPMFGKNYFYDISTRKEKDYKMDFENYSGFEKLTGCVYNDNIRYIGGKIILDINCSLVDGYEENPTHRVEIDFDNRTFLNKYEVQ